MAKRPYRDPNILRRQAAHLRAFAKNVADESAKAAASRQAQEKEHYATEIESDPGYQAALSHLNEMGKKLKTPRRKAAKRPKKR